MATQEEKNRKFLEEFEDQWDFTHTCLEKGDHYYFYLKEQGRTMEGEYPAHISDVPGKDREGYLQYLKNRLALFWGTTPEELEKSYTLEEAANEFWENTMSASL